MLSCGLKEAWENAEFFHFLFLLRGSSSGWLPKKRHLQSQPLAAREQCFEGETWRPEFYSGINFKLSEILRFHRESDRARSMINLIIIDFVWLLPFICICSESHGIISLSTVTVKTEQGPKQAQRGEITNVAIIKNMPPLGPGSYLEPTS